MKSDEPIVSGATVESGGKSDEWYRKCAMELYHEDGEIEVDDNAEVSVSDDGAYVQAWVWVPNDDEDEEEE